MAPAGVAQFNEALLYLRPPINHHDVNQNTKGGCSELPHAGATRKN
jgi:hypothetical protein